MVEPRRSPRPKRPMICRLCGCQIPSPSPPKRRRLNAGPAAGHGEGHDGGIAGSSGLPAAEHQNAVASASVHSNAAAAGQPSCSFATAASPGSSAANTQQIFPAAAAASCWTTGGVSVAPSQSSSPTTCVTAASPMHLPSASGRGSSPVQIAAVFGSASARPAAQSSTVSCTSPASSSLDAPAVPASSSGLISAGQSDQSTRSDGGCSSGTSGSASSPSPPCQSVSTARASSAPVVGSVIADRPEPSSASAPPSLFPFVTQPPIPTSSSSSRSVGTSAQLVACSSAPSSTLGNQLFGQSSTSCTLEVHASSSTFCPPPVSCPSASSGPVFGWSATTTGYCMSTSTKSNTVFGGTASRASVEGQTSSSIFAPPPVCCPSPTSGHVFGWSASTSTAATTKPSTVFCGTSSRASMEGRTSSSIFSPAVCCPSSSSGHVFGWSAATSGSSTTTQSTTVFGTQTSLCSSTSRSSQNFSPLASSDGKCGTATFTGGGFGAQSSTHGSTSSSQSFGSPFPANNCTTTVTSSGGSGSILSFQFGTGSRTTQSNVALGSPASATTNCNMQTAVVTTCWRWFGNDTSSRPSSTLAPSTRSSAFCQPASDDRFGLYRLPQYLHL